MCHILHLKDLPGTPKKEEKGHLKDTKRTPKEEEKRHLKRHLKGHPRRGGRDT